MLINLTISHFYNFADFTCYSLDLMLISRHLIYDYDCDVGLRLRSLHTHSIMYSLILPIKWFLTLNYELHPKNKI